MVAEVLVSVVIDGRIVDASQPATLRAGIVVAPLDPYLRRIADRIDTSGTPGRITIVRGDATVVLVVGSPVVRSPNAFERVPIAPFVRGGATIIPLAAAARGLGAAVTYDGRAHALYLHSVRPPLATMTPFAGYVPPDSPVTFAPTSTPAPRAVVTGIPHPRRTPILVQPADDGKRDRP